MFLSTPVLPVPSSLRLSHETPLLLLGSCFTDEIGSRLQAAGFDCCCNPFGTLYNPFSIAACLQRAWRDEPLTPDFLVQHEGRWHSWLHHGRFSHPDKEQVLSRCNQSIHDTHRFLQRHPVLLCTFGTAYTFFLNAPDAAPAMQGQPVANCHKLPTSYFLRRRLSVQEVVDCFRQLLSDMSPLPCIFTVSPIRHLADGAHGNQLSKGTLLLAVDQLVEGNAHCHYFDSYEIVLDELRDYRFFARDMCHPSDLAVDIVWERFQQTFMSEQTREQVRRQERLYRQQQHRPLHPQDE